MFRSTLLHHLKHRPAGVPTEVSSNRYAADKYHQRAREIFCAQPYSRKKIIHNWRFFLRPGKATSGSAVGQEFTKLGLKAMDFCKLFNDKTKPVFKDDAELMLRVQVAYDKTYTWRLESPPAAWFLMRAVRKKRRETGRVQTRGAYCAYLTLEMLYEIARHRFASFGTDPAKMDGFEDINLEKRVEKLALQAREMGIAIIGVDCPSSPVSGMTPAQYNKQSDDYRAKQYECYMEFKQKQLEKAPLIERLHRPDVSRLSYDQLKTAINDPTLVDALWRATAPSSKYLRDLKDRHEALRMLQHAGWIGKDMTLEEAKAYFVNWRLPSAERMRALRGEAEVQSAESVAWGRDTLPVAAAAAGEGSGGGNRKQ